MSTLSRPRARAALPTLILPAALLACSDLNPQSACDLGQFRCSGEVAQHCDGVGGSKVSPDTRNEWLGRDCAAEGLVCVADAKTAVCAKVKEPCDKASFVPACDGAAALRCQPISGSNGASTALTYIERQPCGDLACKVGSVAASCALATSQPCAAPATSGCSAAGDVVECNADGLDHTFPCAKAHGLACVAEGQSAFCAAGATPCSGEGKKCSDDAALLLECRQGFGAKERYWQLANDCSASAEACAVVAGEARCAAK